MGIVHTPRVIASVAKGLLRKSPNKLVGLGPDNPHIYHARVGLFDVDYLGHLNNAAYLSHAEYARWEFVAENGLVQTMFKHNTHFLVAGLAIRYRREVRPLFRKFEVQTYFAGINERHIYA
jgi:acyl-CoA thioesterase FadM